MKRLKDMAIGKRNPQQDELRISVNQLAAGPDHPFCSKWCFVFPV